MEQIAITAGVPANAEAYLRTNFKNKTNAELAQGLGLSLTKTREYLYSLNLKRCEIVHWTQEEELYLNANYRALGDTELAEYLTASSATGKQWNHRMVEIKRTALGLRRNPAEISEILTRMAKRNAEKKKAARLAPVAKPRQRWKKVNGRSIALTRYIYESHHGPVPEGMVVTFRALDAPDVYALDNLMVVNRAEMLKRNQNPEKARKSLKLHINRRRTENDRRHRSLLKELARLKKIKRRLNAGFFDETLSVREIRTQRKGLENEIAKVEFEILKLPESVKTAHRREVSAKVQLSLFQ